jgi:hypothetical protein
MYINTHPHYSLFDLKFGAACNSETSVTLPTSTQIQRCKGSKLRLNKEIAVDMNVDFQVSDCFMQ